MPHLTKRIGPNVGSSFLLLWLLLFADCLESSTLLLLLFLVERLFATAANGVGGSWSRWLDVQDDVTICLVISYWATVFGSISAFWDLETFLGDVVDVVIVGGVVLRRWARKYVLRSTDWDDLMMHIGWN